MLVKKVTFNIPILIRFEEGQDMIIRIYKDRQGLKKGLGLLVSKDTPLAHAILNQSEGKVIEYRIKDKINKVTIVGVYSEDY